MAGALKVRVATAPDQWVTVGGAPKDAIHVGAAAPSDPDVELWWDSDAPAAYLPAPPETVPPLPSRDLQEFGTVDLTGATDTTATVNAALAAMYAAGGGELHFPAGTIRVDGQITLPNNGAAIPQQPPMTWTGAGAFFAGRPAAPLGGTILDLRYSGPGAKIRTLGLGAFTATRITFTDTGTSSNQFVLTTNTTLLFDGVAFVGNPTKGGSTCDQDAIILGGPTTALDGTENSAFQGYGTVISACYFNRIRRGIYGRTYCNGVVIRDNTWWAQCGATAAAAAIEIDPIAVGISSAGMYVVGNLIECPGYVQGIKTVRTTASYFANSFFDSTTIASFYLFGDGSHYNTIVDVMRDDVKPLLIETGTAAGTTTVITGHQSQTSVMAQPWRFNNSVEFNNYVTFTENFGSAILVQPTGDPVDGSTFPIDCRRSGSAASNPGTAVFQVKQNGEITVGGNLAGAVLFKNAAGTTLTEFANSGGTWRRVGDGGAMIIDSGTGGSYNDYKGFRHRFWSHSGTRHIALASAAPSDASIDNGEVVMWFDATAGAAKLMLRGKNASGTIVNGQVALT